MYVCINVINYINMCKMETSNEYQFNGEFDV